MPKINPRFDFTKPAAKILVILCMPSAAAHPLPALDPIAGGPLIITELEAPESGVTLRGRFEVPRFARLSPDQAHYLEIFLRCRGMLNSVERELGISYPTARARLDAVLKALELHAVREDAPSVAEPAVSVDVEEPTVWEPLAEPDERVFDAVAEEEEESPEPDTPIPTRDELLTLLERGEITVDELKKRLAGTK